MLRKVILFLNARGVLGGGPGARRGPAISAISPAQPRASSTRPAFLVLLVPVLSSFFRARFVTRCAEERPPGEPGGAGPSRR